MAFKARERGEQERDTVFIGIAEAANRQREIRARHRTGSGTWFAVVEATVWHESRKHGDIRVLAQEEHQGKISAVEAARRLLAAHADRFNDGVSIEAFVYCDLEWRPEIEELWTGPLS